MPGEALSGRMDVHVIRDELAHRIAVERRPHNAGIPVMELRLRIV